MNKNRSLRNLYMVLGVMVVLMIAGFYILFQKIGTLENSDSQDVTSIASVSTSTNTGSSSNPSSNTSTPAETTTTATSSQLSPVSINSSILFNATSSPDLQPQAKLTVLVSRVTKTPDGNIAVTVKVFTDSATSYSAVDLSNLVQIFNPSGSNATSTSITGAFKAMPPQSSVDGVVNFSMDPSAASFILQVGPSDNAAFYQFDFTNGSYKPVTVG